MLIHSVAFGGKTYPIPESKAALIRTYYMEALDPEGGGGRHAVLIGALNQAGVPVRTREQAYQVAG